MLYIVYIIKIGPALRKKVKSMEIHDFFNFIQGFFGKLQKSIEIYGYGNLVSVFCEHIRLRMCLLKQLKKMNTKLKMLI